MPRFTEADVDAALARMMAGSDLPAEPEGAYAVWRAIMREQGYCHPPQDDEGEEWKRGGQ